MSHPATDRNLLFGILALQNNFISREALLAAFNSWIVDKQRQLSDIIREQGNLTGVQIDLLHALAQEHVKQHGNDPQQSLAAISSVDAILSELRQLGDSDLEASLALVAQNRIEPDPFATTPLSTEQWSRSGQRFQVLRPHAKGGLGEVFVARDRELHREVALKEIQPRFADKPESRTRFVLEAEITGGLEHPGIVPVYGLGQYSDGRPFYAMRFIRGDSLRRAIEHFHAQDVQGRDPGQRSLDLRKLLGRFIDVCEAIDYAHSRGVLHRDLKPGNVMLGRYGETLVVDWGLAKATGRDEKMRLASPEATLNPSSGSGSEPTAMGAAIGTPAYMSPEQAAGRIDQLGPASDVYGLGATLYHLLTGEPPVSGDAGEVLEKVQLGDFPPPMDRNPRVPAPLNAICVRAMALVPGDRYPTARALADDIEHWLADEPVQAYPDSAWMKFGRFARRHRSWMQAGTAALMLLAVTASVAFWMVNEARKRERRQRRIAETSAIEARAAEKRADSARADAVEAQIAEVQQRKAAQESERRARAATDFLVNTFSDGDPIFGLYGSGIRGADERVLSAREILDRGRQRLDQDFTEQPLLRATLLESLGLAYIGLGDFKTAKPLFSTARDLRLAGLDKHHPDMLSSQLNWGFWKHIEGDFQAAESLYREVLTAQELSPTTEPLAIARTKFQLGWLLGEQWRHAEANKLFEECLAIRRKELGEKHRDVRLVRALLASHRYSQGTAEPNLADLLGLLEESPSEMGTLLATGLVKYYQIQRHRQRHEFDAAIAIYPSLIKEANHALGAEHPLAVAMCFDFAGLSHQAGNYLEAEALVRDGLARCARTIGNNPRLDEVHFKYGRGLKDRGDDKPAEFHLREAIRLGRRTPARPWAQQAANELAGWKFSLGKLDEAKAIYQDTKSADVHFLLETGERDEATRLAQSQFDAYWPQRNTSPHSANAVYWTQVLAMCLRAKGDFGRARKIEADTLEFLRDLAPKVNLHQSASLRGELRRFGSFLAEHREIEQAERLYRMSLELDRMIDVPRHPELASAIAEVAIFLREHGDSDEAITLLEEALEIRQSRLGAEHLETTATQLELALAHQKREQGEQALKLAREVYAQRLRKFGAEDFRTLAAARVLAKVLIQEQQFPEAEKMLRQCALTYKTLPPSHSHIWQIALELGECMRQQKAYDAAAGVYETALQDTAKGWDDASWPRAEIKSRLGEVYSELKRSEEAEALLTSSLETLESAWGPTHQRFRQALDRTLRHFEMTGNQKEVARLRANFNTP